ncbi:unnamed protein product, partial [Symbiodinium sp. KB8]
VGRCSAAGRGVLQLGHDSLVSAVTSHAGVGAAGGPAPAFSSAESGDLQCSHRLMPPGRFLAGRPDAAAAGQESVCAAGRRFPQPRREHLRRFLAARHCLGLVGGDAAAHCA